MGNEERETERRCVDCRRYFPDPDRPGYGWCDEWAGVELKEDCVCEPYIGSPKDGQTERTRRK